MKLAPAARGEAHPRAKLTAGIVAECRRRYWTTDASYAGMAREHDVHETTMRDAVMRRTWKTVDG